MLLPPPLEDVAIKFGAGLVELLIYAEKGMVRAARIEIAQ